MFWFGCSNDKTTDDKLQGTGFKWARDGSKLTKYPFVRVWWKKGKVDVAKSGNDWTGGGTSGASKFVKSLQSLLKDFCPNCGDDPADEPAPTPPTCEDGSCGTGSCDEGSCGDCDCDDLKKEIADLKDENKRLTDELAKVRIGTQNIASEIEAQVAELKALG